MQAFLWRYGTVHTNNTVEGYFSVSKRGMKGVYQHCGKQHLHRYLAEFDFRYNNRVKLGVNDVERTGIALRGAVGKRLRYGVCAENGSNKWLRLSFRGRFAMYSLRFTKPALSWWRN